MKRLIFAIVAFVIAVVGYSKDYVGLTTTSVNFRYEPSTESEIIEKLPKGCPIAFDDESLENGFYFVNVLKTNTFGYVSAKYIQKYKEISIDTTLVLKKEDVNPTYQRKNSLHLDPQLKVKNLASVAMTLRVNDELNYKFKAHQERTITVPAGNVKLMVYSPGTIPYIGTTKTEENYLYTHEFYLHTITTRR
jgi:uncharacterized protein YgiM (DUF1202 family)